MFPQTHSVIGNPLDQMLQLPSVPVSLDRSNSSSRWKPNIEVAPNCPRCSSTNTKFCYYNNYSLSQPRYFCKGCRRYWTKGGSLRNVPVGGGCRKHRRGKPRHSNSHPQTERLNNGKCDDGDSCDGDQTSVGCSEIDMALVFAKFLNQNSASASASESEGNNASSSSNSLTPESVEAEINDADADADAGGVPISVENFSGDQGLNLSGIHALEGFLPHQDVMWCDDNIDATVSSSVMSWQPPMQSQLQELEYPMMPEDPHFFPLTSSVNFLTDSWSNHWSSFDLSTI